MTTFTNNKDRYLIQFEMSKNAHLYNDHLNDTQSTQYHLVLIIHDKIEMTPNQQFHITHDNHLTWLTPIQMKEHLADLYQTITPSIKRFFNDFTMRNDVLVNDLLTTYGVTNTDTRITSLTVTTLFQHQIKQPIIKNIIILDELQLHVHTMEEQHINQINIRLPH